MKNATDVWHEEQTTFETNIIAKKESMANTDTYHIYSRLGNPAAHPDDASDPPNDPYPAAVGKFHWYGVNDHRDDKRDRIRGVYPPGAHEKSLNTLWLDGEIVKQYVSSAVASGSRAVSSGVASGSRAVLSDVASGVASGSTALRDNAQEKMRPLSQEELDEIVEEHK